MHFVADDIQQKQRRQTWNNQVSHGDFHRRRNEPSRLVFSNIFSGHDFDCWYLLWYGKKGWFGLPSSLTVSSKGHGGTVVWWCGTVRGWWYGGTNNHTTIHPTLFGSLAESLRIISIIPIPKRIENAYMRGTYPLRNVHTGSYVCVPNKSRVVGELV